MCYFFESPCSDQYDEKYIIDDANNERNWFHKDIQEQGEKDEDNELDIIILCKFVDVFKGYGTNLFIDNVLVVDEATEEWMLFL